MERGAARDGPSRASGGQAGVGICARDSVHNMYASRVDDIRKTGQPATKYRLRNARVAISYTDGAVCTLGVSISGGTGHKIDMVQELIVFLFASGGPGT